MNRLPTTVTVSLALHAGALAAAAFLLRATPRQAAQVVEGVDLIVASPRAAAPQAAPKPPPLSTLDFLKLALPTVPRAAPAEVEPRLRRRAAAPIEPKLQDAARLDRAPKLDALDLSRRREAAAPLDARVETRRRAAATLAAMPALEDVGRRRVKNLPQAIALDERRREAAALAAPELGAPVPTRRQALAAAAALRDAAPAAEAPHRGRDFLLPARPLLDERPSRAPARPAQLTAAAAPARRAVPAAATAAPSKKGVDIEGPLKNRKIAAYSVPPFPSWAQKRGILEADVSIRFTVDEDGRVRPDMRVTSSSGYGRLDELALDALGAWRFVPAPGAGVQWGVITFRFVLE